MPRISRYPAISQTATPVNGIGVKQAKPEMVAKTVEAMGNIEDTKVSAGSTNESSRNLPAMGKPPSQPETQWKANLKPT